MALPTPHALPRFGPPIDADGLCCVSDAMDTTLLLAAYSQGLFPWSSDPVRWYSPDPRAVFLPGDAHLPRNCGKLQRRAGFTLSVDVAFTAVMQGCRAAHAANGAWIDANFLRAYGRLHALGFAHSVEVWQGDALVGGLYGVQIGGLFAGESMFHRRDNAAKVAFAALLPVLQAAGVELFDAQVLNPNTARLGARNIARAEYLQRLAHAVPAEQPLEPRQWRLSPGP